MRILVTGAAGFIGSSVSARLLERGDEVVGLDNFDPFYDRAIKEQNLLELSAAAAFSFHEGDLLDLPLVQGLIGGIDAVVHLAALAGVRPSIAEPARYMKVNVEGTTALLECCRLAGVNRLVVASSSSVYGARSQTPFTEEDPCDRPVSPYAASKKAVEAICATYTHLYGMGIACMRYFTVYGPRQRPEMAIHKFFRLAATGQPIPMFGDGGSGRDYTYIDDIVDGTLAALDREPQNFRLFNLGGSSPILLRDLIAAIGEAAGKEVVIDQKPWQAGDVPLTCADLRRAQEELGYQPKVPLHEGLQRFARWYRSTST